jgi:hypothetical protein
VSFNRYGVYDSGRTEEACPACGKVLRWAEVHNRKLLRCFTRGCQQPDRSAGAVQRAPVDTWALDVDARTWD